MFSIIIVKHLVSAGGNYNFLYQYLLCDFFKNIEKTLQIMSDMTNQEKIKALQNEKIHFKHFLNEAAEQYRPRLKKITLSGLLFIML